MAETAPVGWARHRYHSRDFIETWAKSNWWGFLNYMPKILALSKGWLIFKLKCKEDTGKILQKHWCFGSTPILFKNWTTIFDVDIEKFDIIPIWV